MAAKPSDPWHPGPTLLCAGTDPAVAARLAEVAAALLADRPAVVLATWQPQPPGALDAAMDALYDAHEDPRDAPRRVATVTAQAAADVLDDRNIQVMRRICPEELAPWQEILRVADRIDAGVIVAGTTEDASARAGTLGRQARALAHRARRPLLLVPAGGSPVAERQPAVFACDGSPAALRAVASAAELLRPRPAVAVSAWLTAADVAGVAAAALPDHVVRRGSDGLDRAARQQATDRAGQAGGILTAAGWSCDAAAVETSRNVPSAIVGAADEHDAAIVVTGTRGRSRIAAALLGSTAEAIVRWAGRPVLLVPPDPE